MLDVTAPRAAETIRIRNLGNRPVNAQVRLFRWVQSKGKDRLVPTRDVVASPPFVRLAPNGDYVLRVVRVSRRPVKGEESYRMLVDEIPSASRKNGKAINFVVRYSIPVFFRQAEAKQSRLSWSVVRRGRKTQLKASNRGDRHVRVSALKIKGRGRSSISFGKGLVGYVLGRSTTQWSTPEVLRNTRSGARVTITAQGNNGPIRGTATLQAEK